MAKARLIEHSPHPHHHHQDPDPILRPQALKRLKWTFWIGLGLFVAEWFGAWFSSSLALLADSYHVLADLGAVTVTLVASVLAEKLSSKSRSYGYYRLEVLAALFNGGLLIFLAISIFKAAYSRLLEPHEIHSELMMGVSIFGLLVNCVMMALLHGAHHHNLNIRSAYFHMIGDSLSSVIVTASAGLIMWTGYTWIDAAGGGIVSIILLVMAAKLIFESIHVLLEGTPKHMDPDEVEANIKTRFPQVVNIHDFHIWEITSHLFAMTAHVEAQVKSLEETRHLIDELNVYIHEKYGIGHTTFQVEASDSDSITTR